MVFYTFSETVERQPVCPLSLLERRFVEPELQLARQRLESSEPVGIHRKFFYFSPRFRGEFFSKQRNVMTIVYLYQLF